MTVRNESLLGVSECLTETYEGAWRRGHEWVGSQHILLALVAQGDPISSSVFVRSGVAFSTLMPLFPQASQIADSSEEATGRKPSARVEEMLSKAAAIRRPSFVLRWLTPLVDDPIEDLPKHPRPKWTANAQAILGNAVDAAWSSGRSHPCRAELAVELLGQRDSAAARTLAELGASPDDLRQEILESYGSGGPRPLDNDYDRERRSAAHVLTYLLKSDAESLPGHIASHFWSSGKRFATMYKIAALTAGRGAKTPSDDQVVLGLLATYEQMAVDGLQFGPDWESCFPAGRVLVECGLSFDPVSIRDEESGPMVHTMFKLRGTIQSGFAELRQLFEPKDPRLSGMGLEALLLGVLGRENAEVDRLLADAGTDRDRLRDRLKAALVV